MAYADRGAQFTSGAFGEKVRSAGLSPSFRTVGDGQDNAMMESLWSSMQVELLNRQQRKRPVDLADAIFESIEIFHNRGRHSALGHCSPTEHESINDNKTMLAAVSDSP